MPGSTSNVTFPLGGVTAAAAAAAAARSAIACIVLTVADRTEVAARAGTALASPMAIARVATKIRVR
jgi:hypothetical protein